MLQSAKDLTLGRQHKKVLESILDTFTVDFSTRRGSFLVLDSTTIYKLEVYPVWTRARTLEGKISHGSWYSGKHTCLLLQPTACH
jgi:hypothetical protein